MTQLYVEVVKAEIIPPGIKMYECTARFACISPCMTKPRVSVPEPEVKERKKILSRHDRKWTSLRSYSAWFFFYTKKIFLFHSFFISLCICADEEWVRHTYMTGVKREKKFACRLKHDVNREILFMFSFFSIIVVPFPWFLILLDVLSTWYRCFFLWKNDDRLILAFYKGLD